MQKPQMNEGGDVEYEGGDKNPRAFLGKIKGKVFGGPAQ